MNIFKKVPIDNWFLIGIIVLSYGNLFLNFVSVKYVLIIDVILLFCYLGYKWIVSDLEMRRKEREILLRSERLSRLKDRTKNDH